MNYELFKTFFKIGIVTFGGGYAMIPIIETEVVDKHRWLSREELLDLIAIAQSCPGVFAVNISTFVGETDHHQFCGRFVWEAQLCGPFQRSPKDG